MRHCNCASPTTAPLLLLAALPMPLLADGQIEAAWWEEFRRDGGDWSVAADGDTVFVVGQEGSVVRRLDADGKLVWQTAPIDGSASWALEFSAADRSLYVGGAMQHLTGSVPNDIPDAFLSKYDVNGNLLWTRIFGTDDGEGIYALASDSTGIYFTTSVVLPAYCNPCAMPTVGKFDHQGNAAWETPLLVGSALIDTEHFAMDVTSSAGTVFVTGTRYVSGAGYEPFLASLSSAGVLNWEAPLELSGSNRNGAGMSIEAYDEHSIVVAGIENFNGVTLSSMQPPQIYPGFGFLARHDVSGGAPGKLWMVSAFDAVPDAANAVSVDDSGRITVAGTLYEAPSQIAPSDGAIAQFDGDGQYLAALNFGRDNGRIRAQAVAVSADGGRNTAIVAGEARDTLDPFAPVHGYAARFDLPGGPAALVACPGDINRDGIADILVVTSTNQVAVRDLNGQVVSEYTLPGRIGPVDMALLPDLNGNAVPEVAALGRDGAVVIVDASSGETVSTFAFEQSGRTTDLEVASNATGELLLAAMGRSAKTVEVRHALGGWSAGGGSFTSNFSAADFAVYPPRPSGTLPFLALLGDKTDPGSSDKIELRTLGGTPVDRDIWLGKGWHVLEQRLVADVNGNGSAEVAVLRSQDDPTRYSVVVHDTRSGRRLVNIKLAPDFAPAEFLTLADFNGNGSDEIVIFGRRQDDGTQKAQIRDSLTRERLKSVFFARNYPGQDLAACADLNANGSAELVLLGRGINDGKLKAIVKDAKTAELLGNIFFPGL